MSNTPLPRRAALRIACAVVAAELERVRGAGFARAGDWPEEMPIGDEGLGLDSLERLGALGALAETFDLDDGALGEDQPQTVSDWIDWILRRQASPGGQITVRTSGSTGTPRSCAHATADLLDEATFLMSRFADRRRIVALVPAHHLYGMIWTALLPDALDVPVVTRSIGSPLGLMAGDLIVAVPDQWQAILRLTRQFPAAIVGVSSAGSLPDALAADLLAAGLDRLIDVYGASETGAIAMREVPAAQYELLPRWHLAANGDDWQLTDRNGATAALPDHVERTGERSLRRIGRRDGAVQVAGHNVWPGHVERLLCAVDGVDSAAVRLGANGRLKAFVVPRAGHEADDLLVVLEEVVAARLTAQERPKTFRFGAVLPRNAIGKMEDWT